MLVTDDDDVGFSLVFLYDSAVFCVNSSIFVVHVIVRMIP